MDRGRREGYAHIIPQMSRPSSSTDMYQHCRLTSFWTDLYSSLELLEPPRIQIPADLDHDTSFSCRSTPEDLSLTFQALLLVTEGTVSNQLEQF